MKNAIWSIINGIPKGRLFDSHFIISQLIKYHSDVYLTFASCINASSDKTLAVHGQIAKEIARCEQNLISRINNMSWSENIHGNPSECSAWKNYRMTLKKQTAACDIFGLPLWKI